jgi:hypothetical protein
MKFRMLLLSLVCLVAPAIAKITPGQKALIDALREYQMDLAAFESVAARAVRGGIPESVITANRFLFHLQHGEIPSLKSLLPQLEKMEGELMSQKFSPMTEAEFEKILGSARNMIALFEKDPAGFARRLEVAQKRAQAKAIMEDLRRIERAADQCALENILLAGAPVPTEAWKRYVAKECRLGRTGADCFGNVYGPQVADRLPTISRAVYQRISSEVPVDFFKPYEVTEQ